MAQVARSAHASPDASTAQFAPQLTGLFAGEDIGRAAPCYIAADGLVYMSNATGVGAASGIAGFSARAAMEGQAITLYGYGTRYHYADGGLTPGGRLYIDTDAGLLNDAPTLGDWVGVAEVISPTDIRVTRSHSLPVAWYS